MPCQNLVLVVQLKRIGFDCFILTVFLYQMGILTGGLLICTLITENQCLFQTLEKFQVLQTWIFFRFTV